MNSVYKVLPDTSPPNPYTLFLLAGDPLDQQPRGGVAGGGGRGGVEADDQGAGGGLLQEMDANKVMLPVLVIACNRPTVRRNLDQLLK